MLMPPRVIYRFSAIPVKIKCHFCKNRKSHSKIHVGLQRTWNSQNILGKEQNWRDQFVTSKLTTQLQ